jgi:sporulation protein YlmC with PRC-barrel domain
VKLSDLLGREVRSESGEKLGHVHDIRAELRPRTLVVTGLVVGGLGVLERLGFGAPRSGLRIRGGDLIAWKDVVRADRRGVVVRDDARPG